MQRQATTTAEYTLADQQRMMLAKRYFAWQARMTEPHVGRRVIEIGCGMGNFTEYLVDRDLVVGLDVVEDCLEQHRERYAANPHVRSQLLDVQGTAFLELKKHQPDTVVCLNVLEHIENDRLTLEHIHEVLTPGGRAIFILPAFEDLYGPIDRNLGHYRRYSKGHWRELAEATGFRVETSRYFNGVGIIGWWVNAKILHKEEQSETQIRIFDSLFVPVLSRLESLLEPPFGQSIFTVLEKPAA